MCGDPGDDWLHDPGLRGLSSSDDGTECGGWRRELGDDEKRELVEAIDDFADGRTPLLVPLTLIRHHIRRNGLEYLAVQSYLSPHPKELMLRNHV